MIVLWAALGTLAYYLLFVGYLDRRQAPAWQVRDNYRLISVVLVFMLMLVSLRYLSEHMQLVALIPHCR